MQVIIPMSGRGERFRAAGYEAIKPLIEVEGRPMIAHVVAMFPGVTDFVFVCAEDHLATTPLAEVLRAIAPAGRIVPIAPHKRGPVHAVLEAGAAVTDDGPVIVNYCDFAAWWDFPAFVAEAEAQGWDGAITAYRGFHPHSLGPTLYGYMREEGGRMLEIREKAHFTADRMNEWASAGTYHFRSGALMKAYFRRAVAAGLAVNGEFYASLPYNLMVADGLTVGIHALEHFLQWGTPEDLEDYLGWARHFAAPPAPWSGPPLAGTNLVPMAGDGVRFAQEGYVGPKPFVAVDGTPMIERALASLPQAADRLLLTRADHAGAPGWAAAPLAGAARRLVVEGRTAGQASTCLLAREHVDPEAPLLISPCDAASWVEPAALEAAIADPAVDALVWTFRDHPHANRHPGQYGWVVRDVAGEVAEVRCKLPPPGDVRAGLGVVGTFWFRRARLLWEAIDGLVAADRRVNGEFYVDLAVDELVRRGGRARALPVVDLRCFGTPDDVRTYEYWARYFRKRAAAPAGRPG